MSPHDFGTVWLFIEMRTIFSCELSGAVWPPPPLLFCLLACYRGWWCMKIPLAHFWKIDPTFFRRKNKGWSPPPPPPHQLLHDLRGWRRTIQKTCVPPGLVGIDAHGDCSYCDCSMCARFPVTRLTCGSTGEDLTYRIFTTGRGSRLRICYGQRWSAHAPVTVLSDLLLECAVSARMIAHETQSQTTAESHSMRRPLFIPSNTSLT